MASHRRPARIKWSLFVTLINCAALAISTLIAHAAPVPAARTSHATLPLYFEANQGQTDAQVQFLSRGLGYTAFLTPTEMVFRLPVAPSPVNGGAVLRMQWLGANPSPQMTGLHRQTGRSHYFIGRDPQQWHRSVSHYASVRYTDLYPDVDLVLYGNQQRMAYDLIAAPGADLTRITLDFQGAQTIEVDAQGDLRISFAGRRLRMHRPFVYQERQGKRQEIPSRYVLRGPRQVGFHVAAYDRTRPLVIDPVLNYSTFLGGSGLDIGFAIAVDTTGHVYVTGRTTSTDFPTTDAPLQDMFSEGINDAFVAKLTPDGSALVYATYLGGSRSESGNGIAVDPSGHAYVVGETGSEDFPITPGALQSVVRGTDVFIAKLAPDGASLVYATRLGGVNSESGTDIAVDSVGHAYITGTTPSNDFPTNLDALQPNNATGSASPDAFVAKLNPEGSALLYSTYLGGSGIDNGHGIAIDVAGNAYVTGQTTSEDFPVANSIQMMSGGETDVFVAKINANGSALVYSTYLGGTDEDMGADIALDPADHAYVVGTTESLDFPFIPGTFQAPFGCNEMSLRDAWVAKLAPDGASLIYASCLGGSSNDEGHSIVADADGHAFVTGSTSSIQDFPTLLSNAIQTGTGGTDAFHPDGWMVAASRYPYLGGSGTDEGHGITLDTAGNVYLVGQSSASDGFPIEQALQPIVNGSFDAFITKIGDVDLPAVPICDIQMSQNSYGPGDTVTAAIVRQANPGPLPVALEVKMWLQAPDGTITSFENSGADGSVQLPAGSDENLGPLPLFDVLPETVRGRYEFSCRMLEPLTGQLLAEDRNPFEIP